MLKSKYIFLTISLAGFAIGFGNVHPTVLSDMGRPVGAILFGLFLIAQVLEKESLLLDEQLAAERAQRPQEPNKNLSNRCDLQEGLTAPALTTARSH